MAHAAVDGTGVDGTQCGVRQNGGASLTVGMPHQQNCLPLHLLLHQPLHLLLHQQWLQEGVMTQLLVQMAHAAVNGIGVDGTQCGVSQTGSASLTVGLHCLQERVLPLDLVKMAHAAVNGIIVERPSRIVRNGGAVSLTVGVINKRVLRVVLNMIHK